MKLATLKNRLEKKIISLNNKHNKAVEKQEQLEELDKSDSRAYENCIDKQFEITEEIEEIKDDLKCINSLLAGDYSQDEINQMRGYEIQTDTNISDLDLLEEQLKSKGN